MKNPVLFYISIFLRRSHYFLIIFVIGSAISLTLANILPPVFLSQATLLLESSQIPTALAAPTVNTGAVEELQIIERRLMTRTNLLDIARSENVFRDDSTLSTDQIVAKMRAATTIRRMTGRSQATLMSIVFRSDNGTKAANVVNRYVTLVLQENAAKRADRAGDTLQFFQLEVESLAQDLEAQSVVIVKYQNDNTGALPSTLGFRISQQAVFQQRLGTIERDISGLIEQRRRLVEVFTATGRISVNPSNLSPEQRRLETLQNDLRRALAVYSSENPKVKLIQAQIAQQEAVVTGQSTQGPLTVLDINLADIDARIDLLENERQQVLNQLQDLKSSIDRTAEISITLNAFNRDYANIQRQYDLSVDRLSKAAAAERIELLSKGRRIAVLAPATVPQEPDSPNRLLIGAGGMLFAAALGVALVVVLEFFNKSIRRAADIKLHLGITPLTTVPYIRTPYEMVLRRAAFIAVFALVIVGVPAALFAVHTYYLPLDLLYEKVAEKIIAMI